MAHQDNDTLFVIAAAYDDVDVAISDYEAVKQLYQDIHTSHDFDASVIAKNEDGKVRIVKKHEQPTRHGTAVGLGWGLAVGSPPHCSRRSESASSPPAAPAPRSAA